MRGPSPPVVTVPAAASVAIVPPPRPASPDPTPRPQLTYSLPGSASPDPGPLEQLSRSTDSARVAIAAPDPRAGDSQRSPTVCMQHVYVLGCAAANIPTHTSTTYSEGGGGVSEQHGLRGSVAGTGWG